MVERKRTEIWKNPTKKKIDKILEEGIEILKKETQKSLKEFDSFIRSEIGEDELLR